LRREARKFLGYFVWKITILHQKIIFFPNIRAPPPWIRPCIHQNFLHRVYTNLNSSFLEWRLGCKTCIMYTGL
jgi:hypothetical protein